MCEHIVVDYGACEVTSGVRLGLGSVSGYDRWLGFRKLSLGA